MAKEEKGKVEEELIRQQIIELQNQIMTLEEKKYEFELLKEYMGEIKGKKNKEILIPIGSGVLIKAKLLDDENVLVNLGANVMMKKKIDDAKKLIDSQIKELAQASSILQKELEKFIK